MTEYMRGTEELRKRRQCETWQEKRGGEQRECATVRMKIYKYVRLGDDWEKER